jgi:hypothetical protein
MFRANTRKQIVERLEESHFSGSNFSIRFGDGPVEKLLEISFIPKPEFQFVLEHCTTDQWMSIECPGDRFLKPETFLKKNFNEFLSGIDRWVARILEEYKYQNPLLDEFLDFRESIEKQLADHATDANSHFSRSEGEELVQKLETLSERLAKLAESAEISEEKISSLLKEVETLKSDASYLPKGAWYRKAGSKIIGFIKGVATSKEGRELLLDAAKQVFLEGPKS